MIGFLLRRLAQGVLTLLLVSALVFFLTQALPGDAALAILGRDADPERLAALREHLRLNDPSIVQFAHWLGGVMQGDLGTSLVNGRPVTDIIGERIPTSAFLVVVAAGVGLPLSLAVGVWAGVRRDTVAENALTALLLMLVAVPEFVVGIALILLLATGPFQLFPPVSLIPVGSSVWLHPDVVVLPALTLIAAFGPYVARILRGSVIEVLESSYVEMARLKGVGDRDLVLRHVLPNALAPAIQVSALQLAWLAGGVVVVEYVFAYRGVGIVLVDAASNRDVPVVQALTLFAGSVYVLLNLVADIGAILVTPRLRTQMMSGSQPTTSTTESATGPLTP
jgi:peptide/nickel transport system permease protein